MRDLVNNKIFKKNKVTLLSDAILNIKEFSKKKNLQENIDLKKFKNGFFLAAGRFTKQKNFIYLIKEFKKFYELYPDEKLIIIGDGELKNKMINEININKLNNNIEIFEYTNNLYSYMKKSKAFILSSLWEEVGFVIVEAALCNSFVISSNCKNGPEEFLLNGKGGILFESNSENKLFECLKEFKNIKKDELFEKKLLAKKSCFKFTMFHHFLNLRKIIENN